MRRKSKEESKKLNCYEKGKEVKTKINYVNKERKEVTKQVSTEGWKEVNTKHRE